MLDRAVGALLATAAGDALGAGYEFTYPSPSTPIEMVGGGIGAFEPREWTDDTAMAAAVARVTAAGLDLRTPAGLDAVATGFVGWYDSRPRTSATRPGRCCPAGTWSEPTCTPPQDHWPAARAATDR